MKFGGIYLIIVSPALLSSPKLDWFTKLTQFYVVPEYIVKY